MRRCNVFLVCAAALLVAVPTVAEAKGLFKNVVFGLRQAGFDFDGNHNYLSGGDDLTVSRTFTGETLDFGAAELTLSGTPVLSFSTGGRGIELIEFSLNTNNQPFGYQLRTDTGNQETTITGSFLLDATASMNSLGFYDMQLDVSSRQRVVTDGRWEDDEQFNDFDLGPIDIRGNIFADLLAAATDPIFDALGIDNIFAHFSGAGQFEDQLNLKAAQAQAKAQAGKSLTVDEIDELASISAAAAAMGLDIPDLGFLADVDIEEPETAYQVDADAIPDVPEPATTALLAAGICSLLSQRRKVQR